LKFEDFKIGQTFLVAFTLTESDFRDYISFAHTRNVLHENPELAKQEGIEGTMLPGRSIIARAEGEMTRLAEFTDCVMLLYGMDGDPGWQGRQTRYLGEVYVGEELHAKYVISDKKVDKGYGILAIDFEITRSHDAKLVAVSRRNLYRIKMRR
jgi:acyl dehydratase